jgi:prepilin-type N-terminal cleavage/methylation domain-containing protein
MVTELNTTSDQSSAARRRRGGRRVRDGFTLTELLVVISIIVGMLAMGIPLFKIMSGSRSVEAGQNKMSAMLQRARSRAIGMGDRRGVLFFTDQVTKQVGMLMVKVLEPNTADTLPVKSLADVAHYPVELDEESTDLELLPPGVGAVVCSARDAVPQTRPDGSLDPNVAYRRVGLVMFGGTGRLEQLVCVLKPEQGDTRLPTPTRLMTAFRDRINAGITDDVFIGTGTDAKPGPYPSGYAFLVYDANVFNGIEADQNYPDILVSDAQGKWLNQNAVGLVLNRYNGTLIRGND